MKTQSQEEKGGENPGQQVTVVLFLLLGKWVSGTRDWRHGWQEGCQEEGRCMEHSAWLKWLSLIKLRLKFCLDSLSCSSWVPGSSLGTMVPSQETHPWPHSKDFKCCFKTLVTSGVLQKSRCPSPCLQRVTHPGCKPPPFPMH